MSGADGASGRNTAPRARTLVAYGAGIVVAVVVMYLAALVLGIGGIFALGLSPGASGLVLLLAVLLVPGSGIYAGVKVARYIKRTGSDRRGTGTGDGSAGVEGADSLGAAERIDEVADALAGVSAELPAARAGLDRAERYLDHEAVRVARRTADRVDRMVYVERILRAVVEGARERPTGDDRVDRVASVLAEAREVAAYDVERAAELLEEALADAGPLAETLRESARYRVKRAREADAAGDADRARKEYDRAIDLLEAAMDLDAADPVGVGPGPDGGDGDASEAPATDPAPAYGLSDPTQTGARQDASGLGSPPSEADPGTGSSDGDDDDETDPDLERLRRWRSERARVDADADAGTGTGRVRDTERV